jgi:beta-glucosidase-like glycosyl hydrolase
MRMKNGLRFPKNIALGFIDDTSLIYEMGKEIGRQAKLIGVHMNLSPVLDVNTDSENIAINVRSFGNSPQIVAERGISMIRGLQDAGVIASAKHFPGLGDITVDPHLGLPVSHHSKKRLDQIELFPFLKAIRAGVMSIQTEHLMVPALDPENPASLSSVIVEGILKGELGFKGLVLSGALRMKALTERWSDEEIALKAFLAGSDMLLMPHDVPRAFTALQKALQEGKITHEQLDERVLKILKLKEQLKLHESKVVAMPKLEQLQTPQAKALKAKLYKKATKLLRDVHHLVPISPQETIAYVQLGEATSSEYLEELSKRLKLDIFHEKGLCLEELTKYDRIILAVYPADPRRIEQIRLQSESQQIEQLKHFRVHGLSISLIQLIQALERYQDKTVVTLFGNPFGLPCFEGYSSLILAQEPDPDAQQAAAQMTIP